MILASDNAPARMTCTIERSIIPGWWIARDDMGRRYRVASSDMWRKGDRVAVVGGQIVGRSGRQESPAIYEV